MNVKLDYEYTSIPTAPESTPSRSFPFENPTYFPRNPLPPPPRANIYEYQAVYLSFGTACFNF